MDLGKKDALIGGCDGRADGVLLAGIRNGVQARERLVLEEWVAVVAWADQNTVECAERAATIVEGVIDTGVPIAGAGAPLVSEFALMELVATLGRSPDGGRAYVGRVIECAWRLPTVYQAVLEGRLAPWRAERIAEFTRGLNAEAAAFVSRQLFAAAGCTWAQIERLVAEAIIRFDAEAAEARRKEATDARHFDVEDPAENGLVSIHGVLDAADGLDEAVARRAVVLGQLGHDGSMDTRRSIAAGELARADLALDLLVDDNGSIQTSGTQGSKRAPGRRMVLNIHLTPNGVVARWEDKNVPLQIQQVREWLQVPDTKVTIRPVIDLTDCNPVASYEVPDRHRVQVRLRDQACRFPHCTRPATRCDVDHCQPWHQGGPTCPCQLVALCRRHHRAKTFSRWRYVIISPAHYLWLSPHDRHWLVGPDGTRALDPPAYVDDVLDDADEP